MFQAGEFIAGAIILGIVVSEHRWYIIHVQSGCERRAAAGIREKVLKQSAEHLVAEVLVPSANVVTVKHGKKVDQEQKFFPGYVLVKMLMNEEAWHLVRTVPKVTGFLGARGKAQPISEAEVARIIGQMANNDLMSKSKVAFEVGEVVRVVDGPFEGFNGVLEEVESDKERLKVSVSILGRATKVDLSYTQVEKVS